MKNYKKLVSLLLTFAMVLSLATAVFADETTPTETTYKITVNNKADGHVYEAYQIVTGTLYIEEIDGELKKTLSDVKWGANSGKTGEVSDEDLATLKADPEAFVSFETAPVAESEDKGDYYEIKGLEAGYYLVKDKDGSLSGKDDSYTKYILEIVEDSVIAPKSGKPTVEKKVDDENDSVLDDEENGINGEDATEWKDSADHDIGDEVSFLLKATLASNVDDYIKYKVVFHDSLSVGLTYKNIVSVKIDGTDVPAEGYIADSEAIADDPETEAVEAGTALTITIDNAKLYGAKNNSVIEIVYIAELNGEAVIGAIGNPNEVYLEYSNNPNWGWDRWEDKDNDGEVDEDEIPDDDDENDKEDTGETLKDKVIVFTYKTVINKTDDKGTPLAGAQFKLEKKLADGTWKEISVVTADEGKTFTFTGIDDGDYRLVETKAPNGYNKIDDIYFTVSATHEEESAEPQLLTLTVTQKDGETFGDLAEGTAATFVPSCDKDAGTITSVIVNKAGTVLPETGGIGTTLFYIIGIVLVLSAAIFLITNRRAKNI